MPDFKFNKSEARFIDLASRGLFQTINSSQFIKSALKMSSIQTKAIDEAINTAIISASQVSREEANKRWNIVVMLCSLKWNNHQPSQEAVNKALEHAAITATQTNNWGVVIALASLSAPARQPSQKAVDRALEIATVAATQTNNWEFVIALASLGAPACQPSKRIINKILEIVLLKAERHERMGNPQSSLKAWDAVEAIASLHSPATEPDKKLSDYALEQLAIGSQSRADKRFMNLATKEEWTKVLNYFIQDQWGKPSQEAMSFALITAISASQWEVFKSLCQFQQPNQRTAGDLLQVAARKGNLEAVQLLCNLDEQNIPNLYYLKNALHAARYAGHREIVSYLSRYLSYEAVYQHNLGHDLLGLTKALLKNYYDHHAFTAKGLFSKQLAQVKTILMAVKKADSKETEENVRNNAVMDAVHDLKAIMGSNMELKVCIHYIDEHYGENEETLVTKANTL